MAVLLANNASSRLAGNITNTQTNIPVMAGTGSLFPAPSGDEWFPLTAVNQSGQVEIMKCTLRSGDTMTVVRAQEGTAAMAFGSNDRVELRVTAGVLNDMAQAAQDVAGMLPPGTGPIPWSLPDEPAGWIFADGRLLTGATAYPRLRQAYIDAGFPFGQDGNGNPYVPDARGRVSAGMDNIGGTSSGRLPGMTALGGALGSSTHTLTEGEMPIHSHAATLGAAGAHGHTASAGSDGWHGHTGSTYAAGAHTHTVNAASNGQGGYEQGMNAGSNQVTTSSAGSHAHSLYTDGAGSHSHAITVNGVADHSHSLSIDNAGSGQAFDITQPTLITNMIIKT